MSTSTTGKLPSPSIAELVSLRGKTAIVTGAAQGLGLAIAQRLAEAGAAVFLGDINATAAHEAAQQINAQGGRASGGFMDVGDAEAVERVIADACVKLGPVDILVNNAGIYPPALLADLDSAAWHRVTRINLDGAFYCARAVAAAMTKHSRHGVIVNITSTGGSRAPSAGMAAYIASKHGLEGLTKSLAVELGPQGIRVMSVAPTLIATPGLHALSAGADVSDLAARIQHTIPLRRIGAADEVARAVLFCASDLASFVSGSTIYVDGGVMAM